MEVIFYIIDCSVNMHEFLYGLMQCSLMHSATLCNVCQQNQHKRSKALNIHVHIQHIGNRKLKKGKHFHSGYLITQQQSNKNYQAKRYLQHCQWDTLNTQIKKPHTFKRAATHIYKLALLREAEIQLRHRWTVMSWINVASSVRKRFFSCTVASIVTLDWYRNS
jgi:hypothetical protein